MGESAAAVRRRAAHEAERDALHRAVRLCLISIVIALAVLTLAFGGLVAGVSAVVIAMAVLQGLWRGATELVGLVIGLVLAGVLAAPAGKAMEGAVGSLAGTTGLTNRLLSMGLVALAIASVSGIVGRLAARRWLKLHPTYRRWDPYAGALCGLAEGCVLALMLMWGPLSLEPVARSRTGGDDRDEPMIARAVVQYAQRVRASSLGAIAERTNPLAGSDLMAIAADFAAISRDRAAMECLMNSAVMKRIRTLESVRTAQSLLDADASLRGVFGAQGVSVHGLRQVMDSPTVLRILDETKVVADLSPLMHDLLAAIREARAKVGMGDADGPSSPEEMEPPP